MLGVAVLLSGASVALAEDRGVDVESSARVEVNTSIQNTSVGVKTGDSVDQKENDSQHGDIKEEHSNSQEASSSVTQSDNEDGQDNSDEQDTDVGEQHRSLVADVVARLHDIADKENRHDGIGEEVRIVAEEQASTSEQSANAIHDLDSEGFLKKLFLGPDYKNIGQLRSSIATTQNHIERLQRALASTTDPTVKADLQIQIDALSNIASSTNAFVDAHEHVFSFFGWFFRLFSND